MSESAVQTPERGAAIRKCLRYARHPQDEAMHSETVSEAEAELNALIAPPPSSLDTEAIEGVLGAIRPHSTMIGAALEDVKFGMHVELARAQLTALKARVAELEQVKTALRGQTDYSIALQRLISDLLRAAKGEPWNPRTTYKDAPHMRSMADEVAKAIASLRSPGEEGKP